MFTSVFICSKCAGDIFGCHSSTGPGMNKSHTHNILYTRVFETGESFFLKLVTTKIIPAVKIAGAYQKPPMSNKFVPDQCSSMSKLVAEKEISASVSPTTRKSECLEDIQRFTDEELEFDEFLMDAAEWL